MFKTSFSFERLVANIIRLEHSWLLRWCEVDGKRIWCHSFLAWYRSVSWSASIILLCMASRKKKFKTVFVMSLFSWEFKRTSMPTTSRKEGLIKGFFRDQPLVFRTCFTPKTPPILPKQPTVTRHGRRFKRFPGGKNQWKTGSFTDRFGLREGRSGIFSNVASWSWKRFCEIIVFLMFIFCAGGVFFFQKDTYKYTHLMYDCMDLQYHSNILH